MIKNIQQKCLIKKVIFFSLVLVFNFLWNQHYVLAQVNEDFIQKAIFDFSKKSKNYKENIAFSVTFYDSVFTLSISQNEDQIYYPKIQQSHYELVGVSILPMEDIFFLPPEPKVGNKNFPNKFLEKEGKLFYWYDSEYYLTQQAINIFIKYNLIQFDETNQIIYPELAIDDKQKGVDYFFCRQDLKIYKKVKTNIGIGYYPPPKLKCK